MENLTRYAYVHDEQDGVCFCRIVESTFGEWVKFSDVIEALKTAPNISVMKLPDFETVNDARLLSKDPMLENVTKRQLRAVYDIISSQLSQR